MTRKFQVDFSNRVEILLQNLKQRLYGPSTTAFTKRVVIVPSPAMKSWLLLQIAKDKNFGIAAGLEITYLDSGINGLKKTLFTDIEPRDKLNSVELALKIEVCIRELIKEGDQFEDVRKYLHVTDCDRLNRKSERRLVTLSDTLAKLFIQYDSFGQKMLEKWLEEGIGDWQAEIWRRVVGKVDHLGVVEPKNVEIHLFALSFLSRKQHEFLMKVAECMSVSYYLLSPCQAFWSDILSDKESRWIQKFWKQKGVSESQRMSLEEFLFNRNPLLANFGRMGREMAQLIEESSVQPEERYLVSENILKYPQYEEFIEEDFVFEQKQDCSLLEVLQADMLLLRNPETAEKIEVEHDDSIQIHVANSKRREIEILYNTLMGVIANDKTITPNDIVVMAPDISEYEPYIRIQFDEKVDYQIMDLHLLTQNGIVQAFMHLLSLPYGRWDIGALTQFLEYPSFQKKMQFSVDDIYKIKKWMKQAGVIWGMDADHREELLRLSHCNLDGGNDSTGTWEHAIDRLLYGMVMEGGEDITSQVDLEVSPCLSLSFTEGELLGNWLAFLTKLKKDIKRISDGSNYPLNEWVQYLKNLCDEYFSDYDQKEGESREVLYNQFDTLSLGGSIKSSFSFQSIKYHLESALNRERVCYREPHLQAIRFCSMLPMRSLPAKVIVLLGMNEGAFPRQDKTMSLNALRTCSEADYSPSQTDFDRSLFLEIILSVRKHLIVSYAGYSKADGKEQPPSILVTELMEYLDRAYRLNGDLPSKKCILRHPFKGYDHRYFDGTIKSYSIELYEMAKTFYEKEKVPNHSFVTDVPLNKERDVEEDLVIDVKRLNAVAKNPVKSYLNQSFKMYVDREEDSRIKRDEDFILSPLNRYKIKKGLLRGNLSDVLKVSEKQGMLPFGVFQDVSVRKINRESGELLSYLDQFNVKRDEVFDIELSELVDQPEKVSDHLWRVPAVTINYKDEFDIKITGMISDVSMSGYLGWIKYDRSDVVKVWPSFLLYNIISDRGDLPLEKNLIFLKSGKMRSSFFSDPKKRLEKYFEYYFKSLKSASPLIPEWVPEIIYGDFESLESKIKSTLSNRSVSFYNDEVKWTMNEDNIPDTKYLCAHWKKSAETLFGELFENWFGGKK